MTYCRDDPAPDANEAPSEFAPGVYRLQVGSGLLRANVYFVRTGSNARAETPPDRGERPPTRAETPTADGESADSTQAWVLVDTGVPGCDAEIRVAAETVFGPGSAPAAILMTHAHPDHVGSAADLARQWQCPVYMHPEEARMIGGDLGHFRRHSFTLDRWLILPLLRLAGKRHIQAIMERGGLREFALPLSDHGTSKPSAGTQHTGATPPVGSGIPVPGLPEWTAIPTPGHTPGHVALFRQVDRVLISGDAVVTRPEPFSALLGKRTALSRPPWYFNWSQRRARDSLLTLAELEPAIIAGGHGSPRDDIDLAAKLRALAAGR